MTAADMTMDFIILAAGQSRRFSADKSAAGPAKQFQNLSGKLVLLHSVEAISCWPQCGRIIVVLPEGGMNETVLKQLHHTAAAGGEAKKWAVSKFRN